VLPQFSIWSKGPLFQPPKIHEFAEDKWEISPLIFAARPSKSTKEGEIQSDFQSVAI